MASVSAVRDNLFGTLGHTEGAEYQIPRKIPLRIEPKTYFGARRVLGRAPGRGLAGCGAQTLANQGLPPASVPGPHAPPTASLPSPPAANERTFLAWLSMATTLGTVATAIARFSVEDGAKPSKGHAISQRTVELISLLLLPISILMIGYALFVFYSRSENIRKKQVLAAAGVALVG